MTYKVAFVSLAAQESGEYRADVALWPQAATSSPAAPEGADVAVLNTCGFIESAKSEAIDNILELAQLKDQGKLKKLLVAAV